MNRRTMLRVSLGGAAGAALGLANWGCTPGREMAAAGPPVMDARAARLVPVQVSRDRIIRTVAGLRPFRPAGFRVEGERLDGTTIIHNYGHGGGGLSLCWGSSHLAAEELNGVEGGRIAVLGAGALGLTTARLLQDRGREVTIYAKELPPHTTSNVAGAQWSPFSVSDPGEPPAGYDEMYERAARFSHRYFQSLTGSRYGVRWVENYSLSEARPEGPRGGSMADLYPESQVLGPGEHPFPVPYARRFHTMFIEPDPFLGELQRDVLLRGGRIMVRELRHRSEVRDLEESVVVNCTGLGSRALFDDRTMTPIKGELVHLLPQPEVDYITLSGGSYMFPRRDGILLGGSRGRGDWSTEPDPRTVERILEGNRAVFEGWRGGGVA